MSKIKQDMKGTFVFCITSWRKSRISYNTSDDTNNLETESLDICVGSYNTERFYSFF